MLDIYTEKASHWTGDASAQGLLTMEKSRAAFLLSSTSTRLHLVLHEPEKPRIMLPLCSHR
jgi:hypothetical protein